MAPMPIDGHQTPQPSGMQTPGSSAGSSISLGVLVDFILQRTYHELTVLAELLPRKTDMERKIEIVQFANRTRQLFVRLLALVKWANSASKVDKCASIMGFLDKQSMLFVETADLMSRMARETLVHARLPNFQLPCAVEVLTTGSYVRLPTCIRDRILFADPITPQERLSTLQRLEQIIQHRLVTSVDLPPQMRNLRIDNGRVTFHVEQEFEVSLTLMGDSPTIPWRLLDINFLVEDKETGDGRSLVHPLQIRYIIDLAQSRLLDNPTPLFDVYNCLHSFSQSLQLEVLYSQVCRLRGERLGDFIRIDDYVPGKCLSVAFWRELTDKTGVDYKLCVQVDSQDNGRPLQLLHTPPLVGQGCQQADQAIKSDLLSFERLLVQTIYIRTKQRLNELKEEIRELFNWEIDSVVSGSPAMLNVPILQPCLRSEQLLVTVDTHLGTFLAHVPQYAEAPYVDEIRQTLNGDRSRFVMLISELKFWIVLQRCRKSVQHLPALAIDKLPILHSPDHPISQLSRHRLFIKLCKHAGSFLVVELKEKVGNPFEVEEIFHLLILNSATYDEAGRDTLSTNTSSAIGGSNVGGASSGSSTASQGGSASGSGSMATGSGVNTSSSALATGTGSTGASQPPAADDVANSGSRSETESNEGPTPRLFYTVKSLVQFDTFAVTHGPFTRVDVGEAPSELCRTLPLKRKMGPSGAVVGRSGYETQSSSSVGGSNATTAVGSAASSSKRPKHPAYFLPNLAHVVAMSDERIPFAALAEELTARGLCHQGLQVEAGGAGLALRLVQMLPCKGLDPEVSQALQMALLGCTIRMQGRVSRTWLVEYAFCKCPISSVAAKEQGPRRQVYFMYDVVAPNANSKTVDDLVDDWNAIAYLYGAVLGYAKALKKDLHGNLFSIADVKSYSYKRLIFGYGPNHCNTVSLSWRSQDNRFSLSFGVIGPTASAVNPHTLTAAQLQHHFNRSKSVPSLLYLLRDTYMPLTSIAKLTTSPMLSLVFSRHQIPVQTFTVIPRSPTHFRISFRNVYCLDVHCRGERIVAIRDGAYSLFDKSKAIDEFTPTQGLKAFLNKFVDESVCLMRRRSQSEDDNPPSPVSAIDPLDTFMSGHPKPGSPAQRSQDMSGLRFHHPATPSSGSNPHTPASPHTSAVLSSQTHYVSSPGASSSFSLASPPSLQHNINPSPSTILHIGTPSPGSLLTTNSPGNPLHVPSPSSFMPQPSPSGPPVHLPSPASVPYVGSQSHDAGSPYPVGGGSGSGGGAPGSGPGGGQVGTPGSGGLSIASPATQAWPGSPSIPRPSPVRGFGSAQSPGHPALHSPQNVGGEHGKAAPGAAGGSSYYMRVLPQRAWAAAVPTMLSVMAFDVLCTPAPLPGTSVPPGVPNIHCSPLERFLSCVYMRRNLQRFIQIEECLTALPCNEAGVTMFKVETLHCRVTLNPINFETLHLKLSSAPEYKDQWNLEEIQVLERFFETKVVCSPYKPNALLAFTRILNAPLRFLKDCIQVMRLEMITDRNMKWAVQWCLTIPPAAPPIAPAGMAAVVITKNKLLFFFQLTRIGLSFAPGTEPQTVVLPIVYDTNSNSTQLADWQQGNVPPTSATAIISNALKRFAEFNPKPGECTIYPAIRDLMANLVIPM